MEINTLKCGVTKELWRDIRGYEGRYKVSNTGKVYSIKSKRELSQNKTNGNGYKISCLCKNGTTKNYYIHRLVAEAFIENPNNKRVVNHLDSDRSNNNVKNLEWTDHSGNINHCIDSGRKTDLGVDSPNTKITLEEIEKIKRIRREEKLSYSKIAKIMGYSTSCIGQICRGDRHSRQNFKKDKEGNPNDV